MILILLLILGFALTTFTAWTWMGLPFLLLGLLNKQKQRRLSMFSLSSMPAMVDSRSVYEFIQALKDTDKRAAYDLIMSNMRKLLLDISKHRAAYPEDITMLKTFVLGQLRENIKRSPAQHSVETNTFRDLAEAFVLNDVMQNIYMADCQASRTKLPKGVL